MSNSNENTMIPVLEYEGVISDVSDIAYIGPVKNPETNHIFNTDIFNVIKKPSTEAVLDSQVILTSGNEYDCSICDIGELGKKDYYTMQLDERLFLLINIKCKEEKTVIINFGIGHRLRVWVNDRFISGGLLFPNCFLIVKLSTGDNVFFIESESVHTGSRLQMRINDYKDTQYGINSELTSGIETKLFNRASIITEENNHSDENTICEFMVIPKDTVNIPNHSIVQIIVRNDQGEYLDEFETFTYTHVKFDLKKYQHKIKRPLYISLLISVTTIMKITKTIQINFLLNDIHSELTKLRTQYGELNYLMNEEDKINIKKRFSGINRLSTGIPPNMITEDDLRDKTVVDEIIELYHIFQVLQRGEHFHSLVLQGEINHVYFQSKLDEEIEMYNVCLPSEYDDSKHYPLLIFLPVCSPDAHWEDVKPYLEEEIIMVDVSLRGWTMGSYIGEAAVFEVIQLVCSRYNVDKERIYLIGFSNGGYAALALAQNYPSHFAAITSIGGSAYTPNAHNLINVNVLNITGENDYRDIVESTKNLTKQLITQEKYNAIIAKKASHHSLWIALYSIDVLKWLLMQRKQEFPSRVKFRTERMKHNKAYWIEILEMGTRKKYCEVDAILLGKSEIKLKVQNINKITLTLPVYMMNKSLSVKINSINIDIDSTHENQLTIQKYQGKFQLVNTTTLQTPIVRSQGMGILDIFTEKFIVVTPSQYVDNYQKKAIKKIADQFSNPITQGEYPILRVKYPIHSDDELAENDIQDTNLVLIGIGNTNKLLERFRSGCPFIFDTTGYTYKKQVYQGDYTLMLISSNPQNDNRKILFIYTNNQKLLLKNVFIRRLIIPAYSSGFHPFLNNEALIFDGKKYSVIYHLGDDISKPNT